MGNEKKNSMKLLALLCLIFIKGKCLAIDIDDINLSNCTSGLPCEDSAPDTSPFTRNINDPTEKSIEGETGSSTTESIKEPVNSITTIAQTTEKTISTTSMSITSTTVRNDAEQKIGSVPRNHSDVCTCDIKISSCDINCCCDLDCNDFQLSVFSRCLNHRSKIYDSRYCYTKSFIQRNNTQFIIERLASNLFCVAYDNLPPIYGMSDVPTLQNRQAFEVAKYSANLGNYTWDWDNLVIPPEFNFSSRYHDKKAVWTFHDNFVKLMELPQSGLTGQCTFSKVLKYLETSRWTCMQTDLSNNNPRLFNKMYNDFTVISSPHLFDSSYINSKNHSCPSDICLSPRILYCSESWAVCNVIKSLDQSCSSGKCRNVIKRARYTFFHNGTVGIRRIEARFVLANVNQSFHQHFEISWEWVTEPGGEKLSRSGNPGYTIGNPIITGFLVKNVTNDVTSEHLTTNRSSYHLTLPMSGKNGRCQALERYSIGFGENVRLRCSVELTTKNFSSSVTCVSLQNQTLKLMLEDSLGNVTEIDKYNRYVSKTGDSSLTNNTSDNWAQILLERIPRDVVTGQIYNNMIRCSALVTSMHLEILYTILPNREEPDSYKIAGVALTFSEPTDWSWRKCLEKNCSDVISVELTSFVTFTDISTPSMYYYAGGPNLDISLPYDFFYPFMSNARENEPLRFVLLVSFIGLIIN